MKRDKYFYCLSCRKKVLGEKICLKKSVGPHKIPMLKATCTKCKSKMAKFVKRSQVKVLSKMYKAC